jgi:microcystin degradation protein MlrC
MVDAEVVKLAEELGPSGRFEGFIGAKTDQRYSQPLRVEGLVRNISDGVFFFKGPVFTGRKVDMGRTAVLEVGHLRVVTASKSAFVVDPELYRSQGIEPTEQDIVAVKSPTLFRAAYSSMLSRVVHLDMPGVCRGNLVEVSFKNIGRPIWPLDEFEWDTAKEPVLCFPSHDSRNAP